MIGIFGGTFNPIHNGHCRSALELVDLLGFEKLYLVPSGLPPHRQAPQVGAQQRLEMVRAAVTGEPAIAVDDREIRRGGLSYTLDTVKSFREEYPDVPIVLIIGGDAFREFDSWHQWQAIPEYAHIVVMQRPGTSDQAAAAMSAQLRDFVNPRLVEQVDALSASTHGAICYQALTQFDISSTQIRADIAAGKSARYLVPDSVWEMIKRHSYYT